MPDCGRLWTDGDATICKTVCGVGVFTRLLATL